MSRGKLITGVQKKADTKGTKINAAEVSRVAMLVLDELEPQIQNLVNCVESLTYSVSRARRKYSGCGKK
jgi:hypothetical protein